MDPKACTPEIAKEILEEVAPSGSMDVESFTKVIGGAKDVERRIATPFLSILHVLNSPNIAWVLSYQANASFQTQRTMLCQVGCRWTYMLLSLSLTIYPNAAFKTMGDHAGTGKIELAKMRSILTTFGAKLTQEEVCEMLDRNRHT
eukprot:SAG31_NODE_298_length_18125_cov_27.373350_9_plen_146_part_00